MEAGEVVGEAKPHVEVGNAACLELQHPQVMHVGEAAAQRSEPRIEMFFYQSAVKLPVSVLVVVRHAKLRYERGRRVASEEPEAPAGVVRKSLYLCSFGGGNVRTLSVTCPYNLHGRRINAEGLGEGPLRYAAINKRCIRLTGTPHHPGGAGAAGLFTSGLTPP